MSKIPHTKLSDWAKGARHWICRGCKLRFFSPPEVGSRTPVPCPQCGKKVWQSAASPRSTLQTINDQRRGR